MSSDRSRPAASHTSNGRRRRTRRRPGATTTVALAATGVLLSSNRNAAGAGPLFAQVVEGVALSSAFVPPSRHDHSSRCELSSAIPSWTRARCLDERRTHNRTRDHHRRWHQRSASTSTSSSWQTDRSCCFLTACANSGAAASSFSSNSGGRRRGDSKGSLAGGAASSPRTASSSALHCSAVERNAVLDSPSSSPKAGGDRRAFRPWSTAADAPGAGVSPAVLSHQGRNSISLEDHDDAEIPATQGIEMPQRVHQQRQHQQQRQQQQQQQRLESRTTSEGHSSPTAARPRQRELESPSQDLPFEFADMREVRSAAPCNQFFHCCTPCFLF